MDKICLTMAVIGFGIMPIYSAAENSTSEEIAVSLVIDTSGSMAETDPGNLRKTAADIFVDMLSPEDYVGIVSFSTDVTELAPMQPVGDATNKQTIKETLAPIVSADGNTNYQLALQKAEQQLDSFTDQNIRKVIIFLTDGVPEPDYALRGGYSFHVRLYGYALANDRSTRAEELCRLCAGIRYSRSEHLATDSQRIRGGKPSSLEVPAKSRSTFLKCCGH